MKFGFEVGRPQRVAHAPIVRQLPSLVRVEAAHGARDGVAATPPPVGGERLRREHRIELDEFAFTKGKPTSRYYMKRKRCLLILHICLSVCLCYTLYIK